MRFSAFCRASLSVTYYRLLFCHGLGSAKTDAQLVQEWVRRQPRTVAASYEFQTIKYEGYDEQGQQMRVPTWHVDNWARNIAIELEHQEPKILLICVSASAQAFLRAICRMPSLLKNIAGLLLVSPAVGMQVDNYVRRVLPKHRDALNKGTIVEHPSTDPTIRIHIDLASLEDYAQNCVLRMEKPFPVFDFPVRIVHGIHDKLVPFANSVELLDRINAKDKTLFLTSSGHLITDKYTLLQAMESLWDAVTIDKENSKRETKVRCQQHNEVDVTGEFALEKRVMATI